MKSRLSFCLLFLVLNAFSQGTLTPELLWKLKRMSNLRLSSDGKGLLVDVRSYQLTESTSNNEVYAYNTSSKTLSNLSQSVYSENDAIQLSNGSLLFIHQGQVWKRSFSGEVKQLSRLPKDIEGFVVSPTEKQILLLYNTVVHPGLAQKHNDMSKANVRIYDDLMYRHWNFWNNDEHTHAFIHALHADSVSKQGVDILINEAFHVNLPPYGGTDNISFSNDGTTIYYATKKLAGKDFAQSTNSGIYVYDISKGSTRLLTPSLSGYETHPRTLDQRLFFLSMSRNGFEADKNDLISIEANGNFKNWTAAHDFTVDHYIFSSDEKRIFLIVPFKGVKQLFELTLATGLIQQLTFGKIDVTECVSIGNEIYFLGQSMVAPTDLYHLNAESKKVTQVTAINAETLKDIAMPSVEERWVTCSDGQKMLVWYVLPPNRKEGKKYPALLYCQGGPQSMVSQFFSYRWNLALMASQGYVVVAPNRRGLPGFGQQWNDAISKDWGGQAINDYLSAIDYAAKENFIDADRLGAVGASYGGYSVYYLAGKHEGRFKTFVSHCGLFNLESWYGTTEELFFADWDNKGPYWLPENQSYYKIHSPHRFVQHWDTPILVIHGELDYRVPLSEGLQAYQAARLKGLRSKLLLFPDEGHWVTKPHNSIVWQREFFEWLATDLHPEK